MKPENKGNSNFDSNWNLPIDAWNMIFKNISIMILKISSSITGASVIHLKRQLQKYWYTLLSIPPKVCIMKIIRLKEFYLKCQKMKSVKLRMHSHHEWFQVRRVCFTTVQHRSCELCKHISDCYLMNKCRIAVASLSKCHSNQARILFQELPTFLTN